MKPSFTLINDDCLAALRGMADASVDAVVTDAPYELGFMGKKWDGSGIAYNVEMWKEVFRVLKDGGRLLAFGGTRTSHRMVCAIEDAGFCVEDTVMWVYGSGFPKHKSKLKPAYEPITVARKGYSSPLNIDVCRIGIDEQERARVDSRSGAFGGERENIYHSRLGYRPDGDRFKSHSAGRWPANLILDEEAARTLDEQAGQLTTHNGGASSGMGYHGGTALRQQPKGADTGGASRFFYCAKASRAERNAGLEGLPEVERRTQGRDVVRVIDRKDGRGPVPVNAQIRPAANHHPTVKPITLMRYLCRLVTPAGGLILDPFTGSGTTGIAATLEGFNFIGLEREAEYIDIARARITHALKTKEKAA